MPSRQPPSDRRPELGQARDRLVRGVGGVRGVRLDQPRRHRERRLAEAELAHLRTFVFGLGGEGASRERSSVG